MITRGMKSGYLQVSAKHQIYFETNGNNAGIPVLVVHGGPGVGSNQKDFDFFDSEKYYAILYDQRGAGKSKPSGEISENQTDDLVQDILQLLDFLMVKKVILFGGSWGSCLSLVFAIRFPEKVSGIVLRGVFLGTPANRVHFESGGNAQQFPNIWNRFKSLVPEKNQVRIFDYYLMKILEGDPAEQRIYAYELERYGMSLSAVGMTSEMVTQRLENFNGVNKSKIFAHYSNNNFFLTENYIIENIDKIPKVPIHLVHGKKDWICLPEIAETLYQYLPEASLNLVDGGHSPRCPNVKKQLLEIMSEW